MITVNLNDQYVKLAENTCLGTLLQQNPQKVAFAVAVNGVFIPRSGYSTTRLTDGDQVDIVSPVGGG